MTYGTLAGWSAGAWTALSGGIDRVGNNNSTRVNAVEVFDGKLYVGGSFTGAYNSSTLVNGTQRIAVWDGSSWSGFGNSPTNGPQNNQVAAIAVQSSTSVFIGGQFTSVKTGSNPTVSATGLAKWNGSEWISLGSVGGGSPVTVVEELRVIGNYLYVGGLFSSIGGVAANNIARADISDPNVTSSTIVWEPLLGLCSNGVNGAVRSIKSTGNGDGSIFVGGGFIDAGSNPGADRVAKWTPGTVPACPTSVPWPPVLEVPAPGNFRIEKIVNGVRRGNVNGMLITLAWDSVSSYYIHKVSVDQMGWDCDFDGCYKSYVVKPVPSMDCWSVATRCEIYMPYWGYSGFGLGEARFSLRGFTFEGVGGTAVIDPPNPRVPVRPPGAPTNVVATVIGSAVRVTWTKPADQGNVPPHAYLVRATVVGQGRSLSSPLCISRSSDPVLEACTFTWLQPGVRYTFDVQGLNEGGWGKLSAASNVASPIALEITKSNRYKRTFLGINLGSTVTFEGVAPGTAPNSEISVWVQWTNATGVALTSYEVAARVRTNASGAFSFKGNFPRARNGQRMNVKVMTTTNCFNSVNYQPCDAQSKPVVLRSV